MVEQLRYGGVPVPFTVAWSGEEGPAHLAICPHAQRVAISQAVARGDGKPIFGKPHMQRQRQAISDDLCDLCGKSLRRRTKVSLSHARPRANGATGLNILQVEPLLHKECAAASVKHCPSLKRDIREGTLAIRQVTKHRTQFALMSAEYVEQQTGTAAKAVGHAKVELLAWRERDLDWLVGEVRHG